MDWVWVGVIGFAVGLVAKLLSRERDPGGFFMPMAIGMGGAGLSAVIGQAMGFYPLGTAAGYVGALAGAILLVVVLRPTRG